MSEFRAQVQEWRGALPRWFSRVVAGTLIALGIILPLLFSQSSGFLDATIKAIAYATSYTDSAVASASYTVSLGNSPAVTV